MDTIAKAFWTACEQGQLNYQKCSSCAHLQNYPRPFCASCGADTLSFVPSTGFGKIYSIAEITRAPSPGFQALVPYYLALVDLDDGVRVMGHASAGLQIDARVRLTFRQHDGLALPLFEAE